MTSIPAASVSVALCTHNGARFIREQVRSICLQTLAPQEIVLSDDASRDDCVQLARATVDECNRERPAQPPVALRVLQNSVALRVTRNFEQALWACEGELIALSDQDDVWPPGRLARMVAEFQRRPKLLLLHTDAHLVDAEGRALGMSLFQTLQVQPFERDAIHAGRAIDVLLRRNLVTGATTMLRRSLRDAATPFPGEWLHDEWLAIVAAAVGRVDMLEEPLLDYRQHDANQVGARRDSFAAKVRKALAPRGDDPAHRARKAEVLSDRLRAMGDAVPAATLAKAQAKLKHQRVRATLPAPRVGRLLPVLRELLNGGYGRFGRGAQEAVRDIVEAP